MEEFEQLIRIQMMDIGPEVRYITKFVFNKDSEHTMHPLSCGYSTSTECLSDLSSCEDRSRFDSVTSRGQKEKVARRQSLDSSIPDVHSVNSYCSDTARDLDMSESAAKSTGSCKGSFMKGKLSITIPQSNYFIFPSDLPKESIVECIQSVFDSISLAFQSRFDKDKRAWAVYSSCSGMTARFKIHIYEFDGVTHVELRAESGCEEPGNIVFHMLQSAVGRCKIEALPDVDSYFDSVSSFVPVNDRISDRELKRKMKSEIRSINTGSVVELESACISLLQTALFCDMLSAMADSIAPLIDRLIGDDIISLLNQPVFEQVDQSVGLKSSKMSLRPCRQKGYSLLPKSEWNAYVRATDVLRRLSTSEECLECIAQNSCIISYFIKFVTSSLNVKKAFLIRRNIATVLSRISSSKPSDLIMSGLTETICLMWLSMDPQNNCSTEDPQFSMHVRCIMQHLGY